jgi:DNA polymerase
MHTLNIDIETYSSYDLIKGGLYKYVEAPDFEILLFAYSVDNNPVVCIDLANGNQLPEHIKVALTYDKVVKKAWNANFERICIQKHFGINLPIEQWECTMVKASMLGLPLSLDAASKALKLNQEKDSAGKALIRYFSLPCKPTKSNGMRTRNNPSDDWVKWQQFIDYCVQDVKVEIGIGQKIEFFNVPNCEMELWYLDQKINDTGVMIDEQFVLNAIKHDIEYKNRLIVEAMEITGLNNPNSVSQLKGWLEAEVEGPIEKLSKEIIPELMKATDSDIVKRVLNIRQEMAKTSVKKYEAMRMAICEDKRVRGLLQFNGANRTGRWAGRLVQVQNLPRNYLKDIELAKELVKRDDLEMLEMLFGNVPDTLSQLIRTSFIAPDGHKFIVADFSAIEARVIAWLADEAWRIEVFQTHGKIYEASAAQMFRIPIDKVDKELRQKGKVAELALGYQGGPNALVKMGALKMGLNESELPEIVSKWREANQKIVNYWYTIENAAIFAVENNTSKKTPHGITFRKEKNILFVDLPSGRSLSYIRPNLVDSKFGGYSLVYEGMNQTTKQWGRQDTYGGKLVENIVQAVARDCLADTMLRVDKAGYKIVLHVHDEIVIEAANGYGHLDDVLDIMREPIAWAKGLPLDGAGFETTYYKKD